MQVKSFGCSFIYGSDLSDANLARTYPSPSRLTWPSLVAKHINLPYMCYAHPASGNLRILEQLLTHAACNDQSLFIVGWSWIDRFDYVHPRAIQNHEWRSLMPGDDADLAQTYFKKLHSQYRDKLSTLSYIKLAIDTLKQKNCPFIMTYMDDLIFETEYHCTPAITDMQDYIRPYMSNFEGMSILDWSRKHGYEISAAWHPLEQAHAAAGQHIVNNLDSYIKQPV